MTRSRLLAGALGCALLVALTGPVATSSASPSVAHGHSAPATHTKKPKNKSSNEKRSKNEGSKKSSKKKPSPHIGQVAKDGKFAFKVRRVKCGVTALGTGYATIKVPPGAQWCLVSMSVRNIKDSPQTFHATNQYAYTPEERKLSADKGAIHYIPNDEDAIKREVNPGVKIKVVVPFQLSESDRIKRFELHDSSFSGGVTVHNVK